MRGMVISLKLRRKTLAYMLIAIYALQMLVPAASAADGSFAQPAPTDMNVATTGEKYDITYNKMTGEHKVTLTWNTPPEQPDLPEDIAQNGIVQGGNPNYRIYTSTDNVNFVQYPIPVVGGGAPGTPVTYQIDRHGNQPLKSGTIYYARVTAFHRHVRDGVETIHESLPSSTVIFMTELDVQVKPAGTDEIEIKWDDVYYGTRRISYDIVISESKDFVQARTFSVREENISASGPVIPVLSERKLSFTARGGDFGMRPGTIYYVKIKPIINDLQVRYNTETPTMVGYTRIVAAMTKMSDEWWKLEWNPVTNATLGPGEKVTYLIKRGDVSQWSNPVLVTLGETSDTKFFINSSGGNYFYIIVAEVKDQFGNPIPDGLQSSRLTTVEADLPAYPPAPDIQDVIMSPLGSRPDDPTATRLFDYSESLEPSEATVAWFAPKLADGGLDTATLYDIWLLTNPDDIYNPNAVKLSENYSVPVSDHMLISGDVVAFRYRFQDLVPNTTYYLKIVAKKLYTVNEDGMLITRYYQSAPALKVIITPTDGPIDQPVTPAKPPFRIGTTQEGGQDIGQSSVRVEWDNKWWELWDTSGGTGKWVYVSEEDFMEYMEDELGVSEEEYAEQYAEKSVTTTVSGSVYRHIVYDEGVTFRIGYTVYQEGMDYEIIRTLPTQVSNLPNNMNNGNIVQTYNLTGLAANTTYVIWLRAYRNYVQLLSEPSDPVIAVTKPDTGSVVVKPTVPRFNYNRPGDTYVDLQWDYVLEEGYTYYIWYSKTDDYSTASGDITVTQEDLMRSTVYRVTGLERDTVYYFWIQADSTGQKNEEGMSLISDSYVVKTLPFIPPDTPKGFGLKNTLDAVGKDYLTFEWIKVDGLQYILEISPDIDYKGAKEYAAGAVSEYRISGLRSNFRYYIRLYAYDPEKDLKSRPTQSITVRTRRSDDDYDADVDTDDVITGPFVEETWSRGIWTFTVTGVNADRLIEQVRTDNILDYRFDMSDARSRTTQRVLLISNRVFRALSELKENVIIDTGAVKYLIRPDVFSTPQERQILGKVRDFDLEISITEDGYRGGYAGIGYTYGTKAGEIRVEARYGSTKVPFTAFNRPMKVFFRFSEEGAFEDPLYGGYAYDASSGQWTGGSLDLEYDRILKRGYASFEISYPCKAAVLSKTSRFTDIFNHYAASRISDISARYDLKSVKSSLFRPNDYLTVEEAVKIIMDVLGYNYDEKYAGTAVKAGFIPASYASDMGRWCSVRDLFRMLDRLYEIMSGDKAAARRASSGDSNPITRGNAMIELYNVLVEIGEI
jgi:hypothetical protein